MFTIVHNQKEKPLQSLIAEAEHVDCTSKDMKNIFMSSKSIPEPVLIQEVKMIGLYRLVFTDNNVYLVQMYNCREARVPNMKLTVSVPFQPWQNKKVIFHIKDGEKVKPVYDCTHMAQYSLIQKSEKGSHLEVKGKTEENSFTTSTLVKIERLQEYTMCYSQNNVYVISRPIVRYG